MQRTCLETFTLLCLSILGNTFHLFAFPCFVWAQGQEYSANVNVMTFNVWSADAQTAKLAEIIQAGGADIVGLQEMEGNVNGRALADALGFYYYNQSSGATGGNRILSRYAIVGRSADNRGIQVELTPGHTAWIFNAHLTPYPYGPYDLRDNPNLTEAQLIATANDTRGPETIAYLNSIANSTTAQDRVFFTGDFNEPSHLDWTEAAAEATARTFDKKVAWPTSERIVNAGFTDSFRHIRPDEVNDRGYTWTPGYPPPNLNSNEVHDRIDMVYYRGPGVTVLNSNTIGPPNSLYGDSFNSELHSDIGIVGYNSDHRAVASSFRVEGLAGSILTFSGLPHNPNNSDALNQGDYGDRLLTTPNVVVEFLASAGATWDTYDGNQVSGTWPNNNWEWGVAQLQSTGLNTGAEFDAVFTADHGFGVVVESFDLLDFAGFAAGHTVEWELWGGLPGDGDLLVGGTEIIAADAINFVETNFDQAIYGALTLRIRHVSGDGTDLAIDNIRFFQVPEPKSGLVFTALSASLAFVRRRARNAS